MYDSLLDLLQFLSRYNETFTNKTIISLAEEAIKSTWIALAGSKVQPGIKKENNNNLDFTAPAEFFVQPP